LVKLDGHIQPLKKLSRWKEPKKGKGKKKKNLYCHELIHKQHHCRAEEGRGELIG